MHISVCGYVKFANHKTFVLLRTICRNMRAVYLIVAAEVIGPALVLARTLLLRRPARLLILTAELLARVPARAAAC